MTPVELLTGDAVAVLPPLLVDVEAVDETEDPPVRLEELVPTFGVAVAPTKSVVVDPSGAVYSPVL